MARTLTASAAAPLALALDAARDPLGAIHDNG
jgi:hypothetical protein